MSSHKKDHHDEQHHDHGGVQLPEGSGISPRPIILFLVILAIATGGAYAFIKVLLWGFDEYESVYRPAPTSQAAPARRFPAEPRLQGAPEPNAAEPNKEKASLLPWDDMVEYQKKVTAETKAYGWVAGKEGTEARIPLERAKALVLERGLPVKADAQVAEIDAAEKVRKQLNNADASAGRLIGK